ncbi:hypothetical protein JCM3774_000320, partial [Rhodotorula dairenensis]
MTTPAHDDKGAYKVVLDEEQQGAYGSSHTSSLGARSPPPPAHLDHLLNHPALPVLCYCASSILMTVSPAALSQTRLSQNVLRRGRPADLGAGVGPSHYWQVINKYVVSGSYFNMNFLLLTIQSVVCVSCVVVAKRLGVITFRDWDREDARRWFPISFMLVLVIYTGSKSLQYLSVPVYTIFKNLTIILIAYGEVLWFGGSVTPLTLVSFALM